jgi:hypothetical protein
MFSFSLLILLIPFDGGLVQPRIFVHHNHVAGGENSSIMVVVGICVLMFS